MLAAEGTRGRGAIVTEQQWRQAWEIYRTARELPEDQQRSYLASVSDDPEIFEQIILLIQEQEPEPAATVQPIEPGMLIGRYQVIRKLACGAMGQVYSACDTELGRLVCLKFLAPDLIQTRMATERLMREAKAASALNHPHIVTVHEVVHSRDNLAIAMELVEGESLRNYCGQAQPTERVIHWGRQIVQALEAAHAHGIVHRDIKPENIMVRPDGYVKVLDFGLARRLVPENESQSGSSSGWVGGTFNYMSPEQARAQPATSASDVFSLGVVLFELATGTHPFHRDSPIDTAYAIANEEPQQPRALNPSIPLAMQSLLLAMLARNPRDRPSAAEVGSKLGAIEASAAGRRSRRFSGLAALAIAACLVAVAAVGTVWQRIFPRSDPEMQQITGQGIYNRVTAAAVSPNGKYLAFATLDGLVFLQQMSDGSRRALSTPHGLTVDEIAWFRDQSRLLVSGMLDDQPSGVWIIALQGAKPSLLVPDAKDAVPSPDGTRIALTSLDGSKIWIANAVGGEAREVRAGGSTTSFSSLMWSPDGKRIEYQRQDYAPPQGQFVQDFDQTVRDYQFSYESIDASTARLTAFAKKVVMTSACQLQDGRIVFLRWVSPDNVFKHRVFELRTDLHSGAVLGSPKPLTWKVETLDNELVSISASRDGRQMVVLRRTFHPNLHVADSPSEGGIPHFVNIRRMSFIEADDFPEAWSGDQTIVFESNRINGNYHIFRQELGQPEAEQLTASNGDQVLSQVSPDRKWVLYSQDIAGGRRELMRVSLAGGPSALVPIHGNLDEFRCPAKPDAHCVLRTTENGQFIFYALDPIKGQGGELARTAWSPAVVQDWALSPDGLQVAIPDHDLREAKIRLVSLTGVGIGARELTIPLPGLKNLNSVRWSGDGQGWYISVRTRLGSILFYANLKGQISKLLETGGPVYAVPSPDGRLVAFSEWTVSSNVWRFRGL